MRYLMSDIHGKDKSFYKMLKKIKFSDSDTLYILGDLIDRGDDGGSVRLLKFVMKEKNIKLQKGNHEDMMLKSCIDEDPIYYRCWLDNGGYETLKALDSLSITEQNEILDYVSSLKEYQVVDNFVLTHSGIKLGYYKNVEIDKIMKVHDSSVLLWNSCFENFLLSDSYIEGYTVVCGHVPTSNINNIYPPQILKLKDKIAIDCGSGFSFGRLGCIRLEDMECFYV